MAKNLDALVEDPIPERLRFPCLEGVRVRSGLLVELSGMEEDFKADRTLDIRGQVCPLTFVRAKLAIEKMALGEVLEIIVDHPPAAVSVPRSLEHEGQTVLGVERVGDAQWHLFVRKDRDQAQ
jgi:TusA-related sulfurtransferase